MLVSLDERDIREFIVHMEEKNKRLKDQLNEKPQSKDIWITCEEAYERNLATILYLESKLPKDY